MRLRSKLKLSVITILITSILCLASYQYALSTVPLAGPYYLDIPFGDASFYVGKFDNGDTYMVDCDTWRNTWTSPNATAIINAAMGNLTGGRTYQEKVLIDGEYTGLYQIQIPSYTILEIAGKLKAKDNLGSNFVTNDDHVTGNVHIEIFGGEIDGNGDSQTANLNTIYLEDVDYTNIHDLTVRGGYRDSTDGESIELSTCTFCTISNVVGFLYSSSYDHIKLTGVSTDNIIANNVLNGVDGPSAGTRSGAIQIATGGIRNIVEFNVVSTHYGGIKLHSANENTIHGNTIFGLSGSEEGIGIIGTSSRNVIADNYIYKIVALSGIRVRQTAGGERLSDNIIEDNYILNYDVAGARGIDILSGGLRTRIIHNIVIGGAVGSDVGVIVAATEVDDTYIGYNDLEDSNVNTKINDAGTTTIIEFNRGYITESYGGISVEGNAVGTVLALQDFWYQITIFDTDDAEYGLDADHTNDHIDVTTGGDYLFTAHICSQSAASTIFRFAASKNDNATQFTNLFGMRHTTVANKPSTNSLSGIIALDAGDTVEIWVERTDGAGAAKTLTVTNAAMSLVQLSGP